METHCLAMIRVLQINVDGRREAHDLMQATANQLGIDVLVVSEPKHSEVKKKDGITTLEQKPQSPY